MYNIKCIINIALTEKLKVRMQWY